MKQFEKAIAVQCVDCICQYYFHVQTIKECKVKIESVGWTKTLIGWVCEECSKEDY